MESIDSKDTDAIKVCILVLIRLLWWFNRLTVLCFAALEQDHQSQDYYGHRITALERQLCE